MPGAQMQMPSAPHFDGGSQVATLQNQSQSGTQLRAPVGFSFSIIHVTVVFAFGHAGGDQGPLRDGGLEKWAETLRELRKSA